MYCYCDHYLFCYLFLVIYSIIPLWYCIYCIYIVGMCGIYLYCGCIVLCDCCVYVMTVWYCIVLCMWYCIYCVLCIVYCDDNDLTYYVYCGNITLFIVTYCIVIVCIVLYYDGDVLPACVLHRCRRFSFTCTCCCTAAACALPHLPPAAPVHLPFFYHRDLFQTCWSSAQRDRSKLSRIFCSVGGNVDWSSPAFRDVDPVPASFIRYSAGYMS